MLPAAEAGAQPPLRVLLVHNRYQQPGGEDAVVRDEIRMLERNGVRVELYERDNGELARISLPRVAAGTLWSRRTGDDIGHLARRFRPDLIHAHNTFPLVSPSLYYAAAAHGIPVVQTLHNFRLFCAQAMFLREGRVCEDCLGKVPWRGVVHRCYRDSAPQSAALVAMLATHRALGTYRARVDRYIALNRFCRDKFVEAGLPAARIRVKPNFVDLPAPCPGERDGLLFAGRLAPEKGISVIAEAMRLAPGMNLLVVGDGPQADELAGVPGVRILGRREPEDIYARMRTAQALVLPSVWYENFPRVLVEAFACGLPVIASRLGAMAELVEDGVTGLLAAPNDARDLAGKMQWACEHPAQMQRMGQAARAEYERRYTSAVNFGELMAIYGELVPGAIIARSAVRGRTDAGAHAP